MNHNNVTLRQLRPFRAVAELLAAELPAREAMHIKNAAYQVNFMTTAFSMVRQNLGVTFCLPYSRHRVAQNELVMRLLTEPRITHPSFLYRKRGRALSDTAQNSMSCSANICRTMTTARLMLIVAPICQTNTNHQKNHHNLNAAVIFLALLVFYALAAAIAPRRIWSRSSDSNNALKLPSPKPSR